MIPKDSHRKCSCGLGTHGTGQDWAHTQDRAGLGTHGTGQDWAHTGQGRTGHKLKAIHGWAANVGHNSTYVHTTSTRCAAGVSAQEALEAAPTSSTDLLLS